MLKTFCPYCGKMNEEHMNASDKSGHLGYTAANQFIVPEEGDVSICIGCGQFAVFTHDGALRKPNDDEVEVFSQDPDLQVMKAIWERTCKTNSPPTTH
ncbi:hypothetical protein [Burkholderia ambifaria]